MNYFSSIVCYFFMRFIILFDMIIHDQHVHSYYSFDSKQSIKEYLDKASKLGLDYFVLTDHCDLNYLDKNRDIFFSIEKEQHELKELQALYPNIKILNGIEIGYKPSELGRINEIISNNHFDLINLSLHESDGIDYYYFKEFQKLGVDTTLKLYFSRQLEMVKHFDNYDVLSHLDYGFKSAYLGDKSLSVDKYEEIIIQIMKEIIAKNKAFEINIKVEEVLPVEHTKYVLELYKKLGGKYLTLSSDAHKVENFREGFEKYINLIKSVGFDHLTYFVNREKHLLSI